MEHQVTGSAEYWHPTRLLPFPRQVVRARLPLPSVVICGGGFDGLCTRVARLGRAMRQAACRYSCTSPRAPRSASLYPLHSREELGGRFLGLMADLDPKGEGDRSLPGKRRPCSGAETGRCGTRVIRRKLDCLKPNLQRMQDPIRRKAPGTGVAPCIGIGGQSMQPPGCEAMSSEGI